MRFAFVEEHCKEVPVNRLCQIMDVSPRGYRAWRNVRLSCNQRKDMVMLAHIREQFRLSLGSYGRPRMTEELKELGLDVGHRRVGRLMRSNGIAVKRNRKYKVTTDSNHSFKIAPNLLNRNFHADCPHQKWAGDISYDWTQEGWLYLAVILDLHSRRVIGWAVSNRMKRNLAIRALEMAIAFRRPPKGCIHHTDGESQYCSHDDQKILRQHGGRQNWRSSNTSTVSTIHAANIQPWDGKPIGLRKNGLLNEKPERQQSVTGPSQAAFHGNPVYGYVS